MKRQSFGLFCIMTFLVRAADAGSGLEQCLPLAPKSCALTKDSSPKKFFDCFAARKFMVIIPTEAKCDSSLRQAKVYEACGKTDLARLCAGVKPGDGLAMHCLSENRQELSLHCGEAFDYFAELRGPWKKIKEDREYQKTKDELYGFLASTEAVRPCQNNADCRLDYIGDCGDAVVVVAARWDKYAELKARYDAVDGPREACLAVIRGTPSSAVCNNGVCRIARSLTRVQR